MKKLGIAIAIVALFVGSWTYLTGTPQYSLYQFKKAMANHDAETAFKYFDIDSVVDNLATELMNSKEMNQGASATDRLGQDFAKGFLALMLPTLKETMKGQLKRAITTPSDEGKDTPIGGLSKGSWSDFDVQVEGKMAIVSKKDDPNLKLKMVKSSAGHWRIVQMMIPLEKK